MSKSNTFKPGRHFLQIPGPTNVPDRVLRAMDNPTIDHRSLEFSELSKRVLERVKLVFKTKLQIKIIKNFLTTQSCKIFITLLSLLLFVLLSQWLLLLS